jgi:hypothetical protein
MIGGVFMKRILIIICLFFMFVSCSTGGDSGYHGPYKLYVNEEETRLPDVYFTEDKVYLPVIGVLKLRSMGGKVVGEANQLPYERYERIQIQDKVFYYDILHAILLLETKETSQNKVLLSKQDGPSDVDWLDAEIFVDYTTLKDIFDAAGIPVEIRVDWENERIYIDTRDCQD